MSQRYLLLAEADKIQDFVLFRASTLREVVGASALLTRFCQEVPEQVLNLPKEDMIVNDGGSFRLLFDSEQEAVSTGQKLADFYYMVTGSQMSVAPPVLWDKTTGKEAFKESNRRAGRLLRTIKRHGQPASSHHMPPVAFCNSAGVDLAARYGKASRYEAHPAYLSRVSLYKNSEWKRNQPTDDRSFRQQFAQQLKKFKEENHKPEWPESAEEVGWKGKYDPRDYVAYLVADGNGMGKIFNRCPDSESLSELSSKLGEIVCQSLAVGTDKLMDIHVGPKGEAFVPVLPLILGGDDLFVLLPAPWAISFAQWFCEAFERKMNEYLDSIPALKGSRATMGAAVVICKSSIPFYLAHERGEKLLKSAKRLGKYQTKKACSTVTFEVVTGNDSVQRGADRAGFFYPSLRPYWSSEAKDEPDSIPIQRLLEARYELDGIPQKRRAQLRTLFKDVRLQRSSDTLLDEWVIKFDKFLKRFKKLDEQSAEKIAKLLDDFGHHRERRYWRPIERNNQEMFGNGLPDLLDAWDFLYDLKNEPNRYEEWLGL